MKTFIPFLLLIVAFVSVARADTPVSYQLTYDVSAKRALAAGTYEIGYFSPLKADVLAFAGATSSGNSNSGIAGGGLLQWKANLGDGWRAVLGIGAALYGDKAHLAVQVGFSGTLRSSSNNAQAQRVIISG